MSQIILGVDPGSQIMGYGVIEVIGKNMKLKEVNYISLKKIPEMMERLKAIFDAMSDVIQHHKPTVMAIEAQFHGKNIQSMLKLGRAQGVAISAGLYHELSVFEYAPKKIKQSITGNGNASKEQVAIMLSKLFNTKEFPTNLDATDGLAVAVCHHFQTSNNNAPTTSGKYNSWESFIKNNQGRVK